MLPLGTNGLPSSRSELEAALRSGLALFHSPNLLVEVAGEFPSLGKIAIDLSGGTVPAALPANGSNGGARQELSVDALELAASPLLYGNARASVRLDAGGVRLALRGGDAGHPAGLDLAGAQTGEFRLEIARADLEEMIRAIAQEAARPHGVTIQRASLHTESIGPRSVKFCADVLAQKLFMHTALTLRGVLTVDDALDARLSELNCSGGGIIGSLASEFFKPYIARLEKRPFPLASYALRGVRVRDLSLEAGEPLRVRASFGS